MMLADHASSGTERATRWCVAAADQAIGRLATEIGRMDAIDLAAPWCPDRPSRHARVAALIVEMHGAGADVPSIADGGRALAGALVASWMRRRAPLLRAPSRADQAAVLDLLADIHRTRVSLDAGIANGDIPVIPGTMPPVLGDARASLPRRTSTTR